MVHAKHLIDSHDKILQSTLQTGSYNKLYSFKHIVNGFAVHTTSSQVLLLYTIIYFQLLYLLYIYMRAYVHVFPCYR